MAHKGSSLYARGGDCITLIGMAGAGKTTIGRAVAERLGWPQLDTDHVIEAHYGRPLQDIADAFGRDRFVEAEDDIVSALAVVRTVISTGGSVVYGQRCMQRLKELGPVIYLAASQEVILERVAMNPDRGLAIAPGQTVTDLFNERMPLYEAAADFVVNSGEMNPDECATAICEWLKQREEKSEA